MNELIDFFIFLSEGFSYPDESSEIPKRIVVLNTLLNETKFSELLDEINIQDLQAEYTRLFINAPNGVAAPLFSSVYLSSHGLLNQKGSDEAAKFYMEAGLQLEQSSYPPDYLVFELAFVAKLIEQKNWNLLTRFLDKHLLRWFPKFAERSQAAVPHPYYDALTRLTLNFLQTLNQEVLNEETTVS